jgi:hypothetical protein
VADLPFIDEHAVTVGAPAPEVWQSLVETVEHLSSGRAAVYARVVGCEDTQASGPRPLVAGSAVPGFHVSRVTPEQELALEGRHRFSTYALTFRLRPDGARTTIAAESRARFPGVLGQAYRAAVIRSGAHAVLMRRLMTGLQKRTERLPRP